jgi:hypothetical protein
MMRCFARPVARGKISASENYYGKRVARVSFTRFASGIVRVKSFLNLPNQYRVG